MDTILDLLGLLWSRRTNDRAVANARMLLDRRRFEDRVVEALVARMREVARRAA